MAQRFNVLKGTCRLKTLAADHLADAHKLGVTYLWCRVPGCAFLDEILHHPHADKCAQIAVTVLETSGEINHLQGCVDSTSSVRFRVAPKEGLP